MGRDMAQLPLTGHSARTARVGQVEWERDGKIDRRKMRRRKAENNGTRVAMNSRSAGERGEAEAGAAVEMRRAGIGNDEETGGKVE